MVARRRRSRTVSALLVAALLVPALASLLTLATPQPTSAAPGDASAVGIAADVSVSIVGGGTVRVTDRIGAVTAPPDDSATLVEAETVIDADLGVGIGLVALAQADVVETTATSSATASAASASLVGAEIFTAAGPLLIDVVGAAVSCPSEGAPTAEVTPPASITLSGTTVELDADGETVLAVTATDPPGVVRLTLTLDERTTTSDTAAATALVLTLEQDLLGVQTSGTITLASTSCEAPLPPPPPPVVAESLDPPEGPTSGGTPVTVQGSGYAPGETSVTVGGVVVPAEEVEVSEDGTSLTFVTPPHEEGPVEVVVTAPGGSSGPLVFTYVEEPPVAESLAPREGPASGGTSVTVRGTGFVPGETSVTIGGVLVPADEVEVSEDGTSLTFVTPPHAPGTVEVVVTTPGGDSGPLSFTYVDAAPVVPPTVVNLGPAQGSGSGGTTVTVQGSGFVPGETSVTIGEVLVPPEDVAVSEEGTSLTFVTPPHAAGVADLVVTTPEGTSSTLGFIFQALPGPPGAPAGGGPGGSDAGGSTASLPETGVGGLSLAVAALGAVGLGSALIRAARRSPTR